MTIEELIRIRNLLKPKFYNKVTWWIVGTGLACISPSLVFLIALIFIDNPIWLNVFGAVDPLTGISLILIGLGYNLISQWNEKPSAPKNIIKKSRISNSTIHQTQGNTNVTNNFNITVTDAQALQNIFNIIQIGNNNPQNFIQFIDKTDFYNQFINLFTSLPWCYNIIKVKNDKNDSFFKVSYKTSRKEIGNFYIRLHSSDKIEPSKNTYLECNSEAYFNRTPILECIFWKGTYNWTLNTLENFSLVNEVRKIEFRDSIQNDLSIILGDISFIISSLTLELIYDKTAVDSNTISHLEYGNLLVSTVLINDKKIELNAFEMALIDSVINMEKVSIQNENGRTVVVEKNQNISIIKLSSSIVLVLAKFGKDTTEDGTENIRKILIEFMRKIEAQFSYPIPLIPTTMSDQIFEEAFSDSTIIDDYNKYKSQL